MVLGHNCLVLKPPVWLWVSDPPSRFPGRPQQVGAVHSPSSAAEQVACTGTIAEQLNEWRQTAGKPVTPKRSTGWDLVASSRAPVW